MVRVWRGGKRVVAAALLSVACSVLSAPGSASEDATGDIERLPEFPVERPRSGNVACRALPSLHTQPKGQVSVVAIPAPAWQPAGKLCVRIYNRTQAGMYYEKKTLYLEQHLRARLWRRSHYRLYNAYETSCSGILWRTESEQTGEVQVPCLLRAVKFEDFFDEYVPRLGGLEGTVLGATLQPGRYRVCMEFWQGKRASWVGWEEWPNDWLLRWPWQKRCSKPFRFPPRP